MERRRKFEKISPPKATVATGETFVTGATEVGFLPQLKEMKAEEIEDKPGVGQAKSVAVSHAKSKATPSRRANKCVVM